MTDEQKTLKEILFGMYQDNIASCRHHEVQRSTVTSAIIAIDAIIIGIITFDKAINWIDAPLLILLMFLGIFGATFTAKHFERISLHSERARQLKKELDELFAGNTLIRLRNIADEIHAKRFPVLKKYRHHNFWIFLHLIILTIAIGLTCLAFFYPH